MVCPSINTGNKYNRYHIFYYYMKKSLRYDLTYGFKREPKVRNLISSIFYTSLYFVGIGIPLLFGYSIKIVRNMARDENIDYPPSYSPYKKLYRDGFVVMFYAFLFVGLPSTGLILSNQILLENILSGTPSVNVAVGLNILLVLLLLSTVAGTYILPSVMIMYAVRSDLFGSISLSHLMKTMYSRKYLKMYIKFILISIVMGVVARLFISSVVLLPVGILLWYMYITGISRMFGVHANWLVSNKNILQKE